MFDTPPCLKAGGVSNCAIFSLKRSSDRCVASEPSVPLSNPYLAPTCSANAVCKACGSTFVNMLFAESLPSLVTLLWRGIVRPAFKQANAVCIRDPPGFSRGEYVKRKCISNGQGIVKKLFLEIMSNYFFLGTA